MPTLAVIATNISTGIVPPVTIPVGGGLIPHVPTCLILTLDGHLLLKINKNKPEYIMVD